MKKHISYFAYLLAALTVLIATNLSSQSRTANFSFPLWNAGQTLNAGSTIDTSISNSGLNSIALRLDKYLYKFFDPTYDSLRGVNYIRFKNGMRFDGIENTNGLYIYNGFLYIVPTTSLGVVLYPWGVAPGNTSALVFSELAANGSNYAGLKAPDDIGSDVVWTLPSTDGSSGQYLRTNGTGILSWGNPSGISTLNGLSGATQSFATGTWGTDFNIYSTGTTHTINIPTVGLTRRGVLSTGSDTIAGNKYFQDQISAQSFSSTNPIATTSGGTGQNWSSAAQGSIPYMSATGTFALLLKQTTATRYLSNTGISNNPAWAQVDLTNGVTGILPNANLPQNIVYRDSCNLFTQPVIHQQPVTFGVSGGAGVNGLLHFDNTSNNYSTDLDATAPSSNRSLHLPNAAGTLATLDGGQTFTSATWNGTAISNIYGGTGQNSSAWTGVVRASNGTWSAAALIDTNTKGAGFYSISTKDSCILWEARGNNYTLTEIRAIRIGGSADTVNCTRTRSGTTVDLLSSNYITTTSMASAGTIQNTDINAGDVIKATVRGANSAAAQELYIQITFIKTR